MILKYKRLRFGFWCAVLGWISAAPIEGRTAVDMAPFGALDMPIEGSTVSGVIRVTGWALDDNGGMAVRVFYKDGDLWTYYMPCMFDGGSRPDIAQAYPGLYGGGWSAVLLTHLLPNGGNGTFEIQAEAEDAAGQRTILGTRTLHSDDASAQNPFGNIDYPIPGSTVSGSNYMIYGWTLTPQPAAIPLDGSTINVFVDGVDLGHPTYNLYHENISALYQGYANSTGAAGYFIFDSAPYADGWHTLYWTVTDDLGRSDGLGTRYFRIQNGPDPALWGSGRDIAWGDTIPTGLDGTDFGIVAVDSLPLVQTFEIVNTGGSDLSLTGIQVVPIEGDGFTVEEEPPASLGPGEIGYFKIRFATGETGVKRADVHITANVPNGNPFLFRIRGTVVAEVGIENRPGREPGVFSLRQNFPNPFNSRTLIRYDLPEPALVDLSVFDSSGRLIRTLARRIQTAGAREAVWDGTDDRGGKAASGLYFCRIRAGAFTRTVKMLLLD